MTTLSDPVMQATRKMRLEFVESLLYRAALEHGFRDGSEQRAREAFHTLQRAGFDGLPPWARDFVSRVNKGKVRAPEGE